MNGWDDLLADALAAVDPSRARAKEVRTKREATNHQPQEAIAQQLTTDVVSVSATDETAASDELSYAGHPLTGDLADFHAAVDQLDRDTCKGSRCQPGHRCRRHTRRERT